MSEKRQGKDRVDLLADVAEMYFLKGNTQAQIAKKIGVTRSMVSRMLTESRDTGIVNIQINRPIKEDRNLARVLCERYKLIQARVIENGRSANLLSCLGKVASKVLIDQLKPGFILGTSWGTAISATVEELSLDRFIKNIKIAQLLGALGARIKDYDGHGIIRRLEEKLGGDGIYLNVPFLVENQSIAKSLLENKSIQEALAFGKKADVALLGVGSADPVNSSYYLSGYVKKEEMLTVQETGAVGDVCGRFFDIKGNNAAIEFQTGLIGISANNLKAIPIRIGVAGGAEKVKPILGALRGGYINVLVTDATTVRAVLAADVINENPVG